MLIISLIDNETLLKLLLFIFISTCLHYFSCRVCNVKTILLQKQLDIKDALFQPPKEIRSPKG